MRDRDHGEQDRLSILVETQCDDHENIVQKGICDHVYEDAGHEKG